MNYYEPNLHCSDSIHSNNDQYGHDQLYGHNGRYSYATYHSFVDLNSHAAWDEPNLTRQSHYGYDYQNGYDSEYGDSQFNDKKPARGPITTYCHNNYGQTVTEPCINDGSNIHEASLAQPFTIQIYWEICQRYLYDKQQIEKNVLRKLKEIKEDCQPGRDIQKLVEKVVEVIRLGINQMEDSAKKFGMEVWQRSQGESDEFFEHTKMLEEQTYLYHNNDLHEEVLHDNQIEIGLPTILPSRENQNMVGQSKESLENLEKNDNHIVKRAVDEIMHIDMIVEDKADSNKLRFLDFEAVEGRLNVLKENCHSLVHEESYAIQEVMHFDMIIGEEADLIKPLSAKLEIMTLIGQMNTHGEHEGSAHMKAEKKPNRSHLLWSIMIGLEKYEIHAENTKHSTLGVKHGWPPP